MATICGWRLRCTYFRVYGSVMRITLPLSLLSGFLCFALIFWEVIPRSFGGGIMYRPNLFMFFLNIVSPVCAFHVRSAYGRFWEGRGALHRIGTAWTTAAATIINMDAAQLHSGGFAGSRELPKSPDKPPSTAAAEHVALKAYVLHMLSLMHALGMTWLLTSHHRYGKKYKVAHRGAWLEVLGGVSRSESEQLVARCDREFWILNELQKTMSVYRSARGEGVAAGVAAKFMVHLSDGFSGLEACRKLEDTSYPFAYVQVLFWLQVVIAIITPVMIACWVIIIPLAVVLTCMVVFIFQSVFLSAHLMEHPFGYSSTKLPTIQLHTDFIDRLHALCDLPLARELENMPGDGDKDFASVIQVTPRPYLVASVGGGVPVLSEVIISTRSTIDS